MTTELTAAEQQLIDLTADEARELSDIAFDMNNVSKSLGYALLDLGRLAVRAHEILAPKRTGAFKAWVEENCKVTYGWAYTAIRAYRAFPNVTPGCNFDMKALMVLSSPSVSEEVREEARVIAESGERVSEAKARELTGTTKPRKESTNERRMATAPAPTTTNTSEATEPDEAESTPTLPESDTELPGSESEREVSAPVPAVGVERKAKAPFASEVYLPENVRDAQDGYKLVIIAHRRAGWADISRDDMVHSLQQLIELARAEA